jgi:hypothetical protein
MKFPKSIIKALQTMDDGYECELNNFIEYIKKCIDDEEEEITDNAKYIKSRLECHTFYSYLVSSFLEDRDMNDITEEKFDEYLLDYCGGLESECMENPIDDESDDEDEDKEGTESEYYCDVKDHENIKLLHDGKGGWTCPECDEED